MMSNELEQKLEQVMSDYCSSTAFPKTEHCFLKHFYLPGSARCSGLEELTFRNLVEKGATRIVELPFVGPKKIESLIEVFQELCRSYNDSKVIQQSISEVATASSRVGEAIDELRSQLAEQHLALSGSPVILKLEEILSILRGSSEILGERGQRMIRDFWPKEFSQSKNLSEMTLNDISLKSVMDLLMVRGIGVKKLQGLTIALQTAMSGNFHQKPVAKFADTISHILKQSSDSTVAEADPFIHEVTRTLENLRTSPNIERLQDQKVELFWPKSSRRSSSFAEFTFADLRALSATQIVRYPGVGPNKLRNLIQAIETAIQEYRIAASQGKPHPDRVMETRRVRLQVTKEVPAEVLALLKLLERAAESINPDAPVLGKLLESMILHLDEREVSVLALAEQYKRKEVGSFLGFSESRVSQIYTQATKKLTAIVSTLSEDLLECWSPMLEEAAVSQRELFHPFTGSGPTRMAEELCGTLLLRALGADHPSIFETPLEGFWTKHPTLAQEKIQEILIGLPLRDEEFRQRMTEILPRMAFGELRELIGDRVLLVPHAGLWVADTREALYQLLRHSGRAMTVHELAAHFPVSERHIRGILSEDSRVTKHGKNRSRSYSAL